MVAIVFVVLAVLCWVGSRFLPKTGGDYGPAPRLIGYIVSAVVTLIAVLTFVFSSINQVGPKDIGVITAFGQTQGDAGPGLHLLWPWESMTIMDGAIQTDTFSGNRGGDNNGASGDQIGGQYYGIPVRLAYQQTATANVTIRWRIERAQSDELFKNYRSFSNIRESLVVRELQSAVNNQLANYNPLDAIDSSTTAPSMQSLAAKVRTQMRSEIGSEGIDVISVIMYPLEFASSTQAKLNQLQTQVADTRVAAQLIKTNHDQSLANAELTKATSTQSLQQQCLTIMGEIVKNNQVPPINMNCGLGSSSSSGLIVNANPTVSSGK